MVDTSISTSGSAQRQAALWGRGARDYAERTERLMLAFFEEVLEQLGVGPGVSLLDVGCGSGVAAALAVERGASVSGLDATPELLAFARERVPSADFQQGEMERLPYPDDAFDVATGFNSFQYAANPVKALTEARRVTRPGGSVMIATWGRAEHVDMAAVIKAFGSLLPPPPPGAPGPFALSQDGALAALVRQAGLQPRHGGSVTNTWDFPDLETMLRTLLSAGPAVAAIEHAGEERVREAVAGALEPFRTSTGGYHLENEFAYLIARA
jgi:ubiquinone/menaquinone biosynthesis C-methylase UbiE